MQYKKITTLDSPLNLTATLLDALNINQNSLVLDIDATGAVTINLPSITSMLFGQGATLDALGVPKNQTGVGAGAFSFYINGTRIAGVAAITINTYSVSNSTEVDMDNICGAVSASVPALVGSCFQLSISGRHSWCLFSCTPVVS
jgi:hypothetical protein